MPETKQLSPAKQYAALLARVKADEKTAMKAGKVTAVKGGYGKIGDGTFLKWMIENKALIIQLLALFAK